MVSLPIPENVRPYLALLAKYHFWILAAIIPVVLLPLVFMATGSLDAQMKTWRDGIKGKLDSLQAVRRVQPHPNASWTTQIESATDRVRRETLGQWQAFWDGQAFLRVWPEELKADFLAAVASLKPDGKLDRNMLRRYHDTVQEIVKKLPPRMGAAEAMDGQVDRTATAAGDRPGTNASGRRSGLVTWSAEDQQRLARSFTWEKLPTTVQVTLAQEELWVYGVLCDAISETNKGATGTFDVPILRVERMAVGFPAAEEAPGGVGGRRVIVPRANSDADAPMGDAGTAPTGQRPSHPRFGGSYPDDRPPVDLGEENPSPQPTSPDDAFRQWIYVDFDGKPLTATELATSPAAQMTRLVPFWLTVVIDQRKLDGFLASLATARVPIDVRQVRINVTGSPTTSAEEAGSRRLDVQVELRGSVGLATPPNPRALGIAPDAAADPAAAPSAAMSPHGRPRRREAA